MSHKTKRCYKNETALYVRLAHEDSDAILHQEFALRAYAEDCGYKNLMLYIDNGVSGSNLDRPALNRLNDDIADGYIKTVIVRDFSRISRNNHEVLGWINNVRQKGISFVSVRGWSYR
jgi:DNA invertase Pin-like site-specific DNA recombinase